jgi:poly(A) polymerase
VSSYWTTAGGETRTCRIRSDRLMIMLINPILTKALRIIQSVCEESYVVGGVVRDALAGRSAPADLDVAVCGNGFEMAGKAAAVYGEGCTVVPLDADRGTAKLVFKGSRTSSIDVSSFKGDSIEEDLRRRDFTINAMAVSIHSLLEDGWQNLIDPCCGQSDLQSGSLRACSPQSFEDDPLRILRAFRFAAHLRLLIEPDTLSLMGPSLDRLSVISGERIRDEFFAILSLPDAWRSLRDLDAAGILDRLFPELARTKGCSQNEYHHLDVWHHSLEAVRTMEMLLSGELPCFGSVHDKVEECVREEPVAGRSRSALLKLTALFHDVGKPDTRFIDERGKVRFFGHEHVSAELFSPVANRLKLATREAATIVHWIAGHMRAIVLFGQSVSPRALYRLQRAYGQELPGLLILFLADLAATRGPARPQGLDDDVCRRVREAIADCNEIQRKPPVPFLNGRDVMQMFGLSPGPEVGRILGRLAELQAIGEIASEEEARAVATKVRAESP